MMNPVLSQDAHTPDWTQWLAEQLELCPYTPGESIETFCRRVGLPVERIIKLNANESPYGVLPEVKEILSQHERYNIYPDTQAALLKEALTAYTGLGREHIILGHGSMEVMRLLWQLFLAPGEQVMVCSPTYSLYRSLTIQRGAKVQEVARTVEDTIDLGGMLAALNPNTKMIVLCSPNNPTGGVLYEEVLEAILETGKIVVVDEAYVEFSDRPAGFASLIPRYPNLMITRTFSKWAGLAGLRVGYGLVPQWVLPYLQGMQAPFEVNVAGHLAAAETLFHLEKAQTYVEQLIQERSRLFQVLAAQPYLEPFPSQGNFVLARIVDERISLATIQEQVEAEGILLRYFPGLLGDDCVRVTVGLPEHTDLLAQILRKIGSKLQSTGS